MKYVISLIEPDVACTTCATNDLSSTVYDVLYDIEQDEELSVGVGGSFFGYVKGFKLDESEYESEDYALHNHITVEEHLLFGYQAEFVIIGKDIFFTKKLDASSYASIFEEYPYHYAVGLEIGGNTLDNLTHH